MQKEAIEERKNALEGVKPKTTSKAFSCFGKKATPKVVESQKEEAPKKVKAKRVGHKHKGKSKDANQDAEEGMALLGLKEQGVESCQDLSDPKNVTYSGILVFDKIKLLKFIDSMIE